MAIAGGDILTVTGGDRDAVEIAPAGPRLPTAQLDRSGSRPGAGALFGLAVTASGRAVCFVDDAANTLNLLH